jgi:hypothetical protein
VADERTITLTDEQRALAWQLTCALVSNEDSKRTLDQALILAARFVERVENGVETGGVDLDTGKGASPMQKVVFRLQRSPG